MMHSGKRARRLYCARKRLKPTVRSPITRSASRVSFRIFPCSSTLLSKPCRDFAEGNMTDASTSLDMSTGLRKVAERAKREPAARFHSLAHLIDEELLAGAYARLRNNAAVGVDDITKVQYGQDVQSNLRDLHERLRTKRYRHQPIRRVHIPKEKGGTRPIGISTTEDKVVQNALREVLETLRRHSLGSQRSRGSATEPDEPGDRCRGERRTQATAIDPGTRTIRVGVLTRSDDRGVDGSECR